MNFDQPEIFQFNIQIYVHSIQSKVKPPPKYPTAQRAIDLFGSEYICHTTQTHTHTHSHNHIFMLIDFVIAEGDTRIQYQCFTPHSQYFWGDFYIFFFFSVVLF